jgi:hypothetical protein
VLNLVLQQPIENEDGTVFSGCDDPKTTRKKWGINFGEEQNPQIGGYNMI